MTIKHRVLHDVLSRLSLSSIISKTHVGEPEPETFESKSTPYQMSLHDSVMELSRPPTQHQTTHAPLFTLPIEIIHEITSYLSLRETSSFLLTSRSISYALGTQPLHTFLSTSLTKHSRRQNLEIIERAFPSHWYCAWCDKFHAQDAETGPRRFYKETPRDCAEYSSFLHFERRYVLTYAHVRAVVNRWLWGREYGIPIESLDYGYEGTIRLFKTPCLTTLSIAAKIVPSSSHLLLHSVFDIHVPKTLISRRDLVSKILPHLPQIVAGHRNDHLGHTGLKTNMQQVLQNQRNFHIQLCSVCATDFVAEIVSPSSTHLQNTDLVTTSTDPESSVVLRISAWRDLGDARNPFSAAWRAHGELGHGFEGYGADLMRLAGCEPGRIREAWLCEEKKERMGDGGNERYLSLGDLGGRIGMEEERGERV